MAGQPLEQFLERMAPEYQKIAREIEMQYDREIALMFARGCVVGLGTRRQQARVKGRRRAQARPAVEQGVDRLTKSKPSRKQVYESYISSDRWALKRQEFWLSVGRPGCQVPGCSGDDIGGLEHRSSLGASRSGQAGGSLFPVGRNLSKGKSE